MKLKFGIACLLLIVCLISAGCTSEVTDTSDNADESITSQSSEHTDAEQSTDLDNGNNASSETKQDDEASEPQNTSTDVSDTGSDVSSDVNNEAPLDRTTFEFDSFDELKRHFSTDGSRLTTDSDTVLRNEEYDALAKRIYSEKSSVFRPYINGKPMELRNKEGFNNITLFTSELYGRPWIWYHCVNNSNEYTIKVMYLTEAEASTSKMQTASSYIAAIAPDAPNVGNAEKFSSYDKIYEGDFKTNDVTVKALYYQLKSGKTTVSFVLNNNVLVMITGNSQSIASDFADGFSIA